MMDRIRVILDGAGDGAWNMGVDEALLASAQQGVTTLRFYEWSPPTLSLGYFQALNERQTHEASRTCAVVRRATGGGAILHDQELTYSIALPSRDRFSAAAEAIYDLFHDSLIEALRAWNVTAVRCALSDPTRENRFLCFERRAKGDVLLDSWKIAGSAQRRRAGALLQHGSVLLAKSQFAPSLPGISDLLARPIALGELRDRWLAQLLQRTGWQGVAGNLTAGETGQANEFVITLFAQEGWIGRR